MASWRSGPTADKELRPPHGRPIYAVAVHNDQCVTASADHGLRVFNLKTGAHLRQLYNKKYGHQEWVSCCSFLRDGRVLSGGMDSVLCLWDRKAVRCDSLRAHSASISQVMTDNRNVALSASYDSNVIVWNLDSLQLLKTCTLDAPVVAMDWRNSLMVGGTRGGQVSLWDVNTCQNLASFNNHSGQVAKTKLYSDGSDTHLVASTGSNDGKLVVRDMRTHEAIFERQIHRGAINYLDVRFDNCVITGSVDKSLKVWDVTAGFTLRANLETTGGVLCGELADSLAVVGCTDGNVLVFDLDLQDCCFGFGADSQGGVNCLAIGLSCSRLITGGDSGTPLLLSFD